MFSSRQQLAKRTGPDGVGRLSFLQSLVTEFQDTTSEEAKVQVLANLANFAYDPINYHYLRQLHVIDLFLDCLSLDNDEMQQYAVGGICNLCLDHENKAYILSHDGVNQVITCLSSSNEETVVTAISTLMFLVTPQSKTEITTRPVMEAMVQLSASRNPRLSNLATIFLEDYCHKSQVDNLKTEFAAAENAQENASNSATT